MTPVKKFPKTLACAIFSFGMLVSVAPASAGDYTDALKDVTQIRAVFDFTEKSAEVADIFIWPIQDVYKGEAVTSLPDPPMVAVVFHGPAVKLLSTDPSNYEDQDAAEVKRFQDALAQMKEDGVKLEVCSYSLKVRNVDPDTIIAAVDKVPNGFVSLLGYQMQGYESIRIP